MITWFENLTLKVNPRAQTTCTEILLEYWEYAAATAAAKSHQSCPTLCDPIDSSPPGSSVPGILQARILEWVAISFSNWEYNVVQIELI